MALCRNFSSPVSTTDLVNSPKDAASHLVCTWKHFLLGECRFFVNDIISRGLLDRLGPSHGSRLKPLDGSILLKFLLETRLQFDSFDNLDDLLGFQVRKSWSKVINIFLDHKFWSRNGSKSIKGSKDSDSSLLSNKNFIKILWLSGWALGQVTWAKMALKLPDLWRHSQKICNPKPKNFFQVQTRRLANRFEALNSSLAQSAEELCCW